MKQETTSSIPTGAGSRMRQIIMHPCDKERAERMAAQMGARVLLAENCDPSRVVLQDFSDDAAAYVENQLRGWTVCRVDQRERGA